MARAMRVAWQLAAGVALGCGQVAAASCPDRGRDEVAIAGVEPRLELRLADGRLIRMVGLDPALQTPADADLPETSRARLTALLAGKRVTITFLSGVPDRWQRIPALVFAGDGAPRPGGLASMAIAAGLGRYLAEPAAHPCREVLIAAEREARSAALGLWRDPYYSVLAVDDHAGFDERSATIVVAEGKLTAVQPSPYRTTLRFAASGQASHGGQMLVATIPPRLLKSFEAEHVDLKALVGRRLRIRGLLDQRFGPRIELDGPDALETDLPPTEMSAPTGAH